MLLIYFDTKTESYFSYIIRFDSSKIVGQSNKFGSILVGLYLIDYLENKLVPYNSGWFAELDYRNRYEEERRRNRKEEGCL